MYEVSRVNIKVKRGLTFTFTRNLSYIASILFTRVKISRLLKSTLTLSNSLHNGCFMSQARRTRHFARSAKRREDKRHYALRAKCRVCLAWLTKCLLCRLAQQWMTWVYIFNGAHLTCLISPM